jgi:hypothetical protein
LDHEKYKCSYFQYTDDLTNKIKNFLKENNMKEQIKSLLEYKKELKSLNNNENNKTKKSGLIYNNNELMNMKKNYQMTSVKTFTNCPHSEFEFNILKYKEGDIASVITYISIKYYNNLYNHLYELNPSIKKKETDKPHLLALIDFSNKLSNFLIEESLSYDFLEVRVKIVEKIIKVLIELRNLNNFNDLLSVSSALYSIFSKLPKTCGQIEQRLQIQLKEIQQLCSLNECYKNIINESNKCKQINRFYVPFIGITLKHINFYDEGTKYIGHNGLVCIEKIIVTQKELESFRNEIKPLRYEKMKLKKNKEINELKSIFYNLCPKDYDALVNVSDKLEPVFTLYKEPDKRKRKTNTELYINSNDFLLNLD